MGQAEVAPPPVSSLGIGRALRQNFVVSALMKFSRGWFACLFSAIVTVQTGVTRAEQALTRDSIGVFETTKLKTEGSKPFEFQDLESPQIIKGFYIPVSLLDPGDIATVREQTWAWIKPVPAVFIKFTPAGRVHAKKWIGKIGSKRLLITINQVPRATFKGAFLFDVINAKQGELIIRIPEKR